MFFTGRSWGNLLQVIEIFLALPLDPYVSIFEDPLGELLLEKESLRLIVFQSSTGEIARWIG